MAKKLIFDEATLEEIRLLYACGWTLKEVSARYGNSVSTWHKLLGKRAKKRPRVTERHREMAWAHEDGKSFTEIGATYGISRQRVHQLVKRVKLSVDRTKRPTMVDETKENRDE